MQFLKQSTVVTIQMGPFLASSDGITAQTGLSLTPEVSKAGAAFGARSSATAISHDTDGWYRVELNATDTATLGRLIVKDVQASTIPVWHEFTVVPAAIYDSIIAGTLLQTVNLTQIDGLATSGNNATLNLKQLNIVNNAGSALVASSTGGNGHGIQVSGNGSGEGLSATGGATGNGADFIGGSTSGDGLRCTATSGDGIDAVGGTAGIGLKATGGATGAGGAFIGGATSGTGLAIQAVGNGRGLLVEGVGSSRAGITVNGSTSNGSGIEVSGYGSAAAVWMQGGEVAGNGLEIWAGPGGGSAIQARANDAGHGIWLDAGTDSGDAVHLTSDAGKTINDAGVDAILDRAITEPSAIWPWANASLRTIVGWLGVLSRNKITQTATTQTVRNDADGATIASSTHSDDGTTHQRGRFS